VECDDLAPPDPARPAPSLTVSARWVGSAVVDRDFWISDLTDDDLPAVVALCRTALDLPDDALEAAEIVRRLRENSGAEEWAAQPRRLAGFVALVPAAAASGGPVPERGGRMIGVVLGSLSQRDPSVGHVDLLAVAPELRRHGVGRALVSRIEEAFAGLGTSEVVISGNPPYYGWPGIDVRYTPALCVAMALGFEPDRPAWNMTVDLGDPGSLALRPTAPAERRLADAGITVRRAERGDVPALIEFAVTNFSAGWAGEIAHSVGRDRAGCHVAIGAAGVILGFAAYGSSRPSWFGPMGTALAAQGMGIGSVLLLRCLADQKAAGYGSVQISWVGPVPFYSAAVGARIERVFFRYRKQL
jgi:mycothiol synthase